MAIVETRYSVPGWGAAEIWRNDGVLVEHDFHFGRDVVESGFDPLVERFRAYLAGASDDFRDVAIDLDWATPLQRAIVDALRAVPRGEVVSYGELAALAGRPRAPRAAGAVCSANRFSFIVPCHRVIGANGIGSYGSAGIAVKRRLLALEGVVL
ncbi:MAG TPA: methylated-DNA--[protein]-cysteine S-methyltransferase [Gaiellaceae bacterium]|nr:methylated-DNA--[protein]-cysteine S-methyltransferase [Gaiellaceae bacterium]